MKAGDVYKTRVRLTIIFQGSVEPTDPYREHILPGEAVMLAKPKNQYSLWMVHSVNGSVAYAYEDALTPVTPLEALALFAAGQ